MLPFEEGSLAESAFHLFKFWQGDGRIDLFLGLLTGASRTACCFVFGLVERKRVLFTMRSQLGRRAAISALVLAGA
jgi:hypothetical protein